MNIETLVLGPVNANCYIVTDEKTNETAVIDCGEYTASLEEKLIDKNLKYILLTHGHFDHIKGVKKLKADFGGEVVIHSLDADCLYDSSKSLGDFFGLSMPSFEADKTVIEGDRLPFGNSEIEVIHTPGHTVGSVCYKIGDMIFSGDTLFCGSIGRTDFPGGSMLQMTASLKKLSKLEGNYKVYPGHDDITDLDRERKYNIYMKGM